MPADPPPGGLGGVARRTACGIFVRCRLVRGCAARRRLPRALGSPPSRDADLCLRLLEVGLPMGCCTPVGFKFLPPLGQSDFFWLQETLLVASSPLITHKQPPDCGSGAQSPDSRQWCANCVARPRLDEVLRCCQKSLKFGKDAVSTITRCETSSASQYASSSHASSARSVLPCKCAAAQVVPPPRWATTKPPKDY